jgi:hypothetical protein
MMLRETIVLVGGLVTLWLIVLSYKVGLALACVITAVILFFAIAFVLFVIEQAGRLLHWLVRKRMLP